jgi:phosphoglycolate phosphatase
MKLAIIFDFDGVIVNSLEVWRDAFISACDHHGCESVTTQEDFLNLFESNIFDGLKKAGIEENKIPSIRKKLAEEYLENSHKVELFEGVKEMLETLAADHKIFIVTSNFSDIVERFLDSYNIKIFEEVLGSDKERSKVKKIELIKINFSDLTPLYVGDTKGDMIEGALAGVKTIAVTWGWHDRKKLKEADPDFVIDVPKELVLLADQLSK